MKLVSTYFFAFLLSLGHLSSAETAKQELITHTWSGTEDELFFDMKLVEGLDFPDMFSITTDKTSQTAELIFEPKPGKSIRSNEGTGLKKTVLKVTVKNTDNPSRVDYFIEIQKIYNKGMSNQTSTIKTNGTLINPAIDVSVDPEYNLFAETDREGQLSFRNMFPYSQAK